MLGYFKPGNSISPEARRQYQVIYCTLCHNLKRLYGTRASMLLQHDPIFFSIQSGFLPSIDEEKVIKKSCIIQPKKVEVLAGYEAYFDPLSDLSVLMILIALWDKEFDNEITIRNRIFLKILGKVFRLSERKLAEREISISDLKSECFAALEVERDSKLNPLDRLSKFIEFGGRLTAEFFPANGNSERSESISMNMLKIMYLVDALEDFHSDVAKGSFNLLQGQNREDMVGLVERGVESSLKAIYLQGKPSLDTYYREIVSSAMNSVMKSLEIAKEKFDKEG